MPLLSKKTVKQKAEQQGRLSETIAAWILRFKGYSVIKSRYKTPVGEIDLVASRGSVIVAVEVKSRPDMIQALESVRYKQKKRIFRALEFFLMKEQKYTNAQLRFDVICVYPFGITHIKNAWNENDVC